MPLPNGSTKTPPTRGGGFGQQQQGGGGAGGSGAQSSQGRTGTGPDWNQGGFWPNPENEHFKKGFRPHEFIGKLVNSPDAQNYADVEGAARSIGVQGVREGEAQNIEESKAQAASQGLGRGYAEQVSAGLRMGGTIAASEQMLGANLEGRARRFQLASLLASSLVEANKARYAKFLQDRAAESAEDAALIGAAGTALGGLFEGLGNAAGGGAFG